MGAKIAKIVPQLSLAAQFRPELSKHQLWSLNYAKWVNFVQLVMWCATVDRQVSTESD